MPSAQGFGTAAGLLTPCESTCCFLVNGIQPQAINYHYRYSSQILLHRKSHEADLVKEALHRETQALLSRLTQIKELLSSSDIRKKISKELFEDRHNSSSKWKSCIDSGSPNA